MLNQIVSYVSSPKVVATTLVVIGLSNFIDFKMLRTSFGTLPLFGSVTPLRLFGAAGVIAGASMLMGRGQMIGARDFVALSAEMLEGGYAHGHL